MNMAKSNSAEQKIHRIHELETQLRVWQSFASKILDILDDSDHKSKNYRSVLHHIRVLLNKKTTEHDQFDLRCLNDEAGLLRVNYQYASEEIERLKTAILNA